MATLEIATATPEATATATPEATTRKKKRMLKKRRRKKKPLEETVRILVVRHILGSCA